MKPSSLASVLIKVLGIATICDGICHLSGLLMAILIPILVHGQDVAVKDGIILKTVMESTFSLFGIVSLVLGVFLLTKTDFLVKRVLKITDPD